MMDGRCETCKWWERDGGLYRKCRNVETLWDTPEFTDAAYITDCAAQPLPAHFVTGKTFGCIHHEPKSSGEDTESSDG